MSCPYFPTTQLRVRVHPSIFSFEDTLNSPAPLPLHCTCLTESKPWINPMCRALCTSTRPAETGWKKYTRDLWVPVCHCPETLPCFSISVHSFSLLDYFLISSSLLQPPFPSLYSGTKKKYRKWCLVKNLAETPLLQEAACLWAKTWRHSAL